MNYYITQNPKTNLYSFTACKPDPTVYNENIVVAEFFDIDLNEVKSILTSKPWQS